MYLLCAQPGAEDRLHLRRWLVQARTCHSGEARDQAQAIRICETLFYPSEHYRTASPHHADG